MRLQQRNMITSEDIYEDLCRKIINLEYMPGEALSENVLCERYGTSRHMVRGAFNLLKQRRLLEVYPQRGSYVSLIDLDYISDLMFMREAIEQECLQRILEADRTDQVCARLEENLKKQERCVADRESRSRFLELDSEFHRLILEAAGKPDIMQQLEDSYIHVRRCRNLDIDILERQEELLEQHRDIWEKLRARDRQAVRESMHRHMDTVGLERSMREKAEVDYFYRR